MRRRRPRGGKEVKTSALSHSGYCDRNIIDWVDLVKWKSLSHVQPHGLYIPRNSLGQNPGVGSLSLLQGIFPTQESNPGLPHCRRILYQLSHQGSPGWLRQQTFDAHSFRGWEVWDQGDSTVSGENPPSGLHPSIFLHVLTWWREREEAVLQAH